MQGAILMIVIINIIISPSVIYLEPIWADFREEVGFYPGQFTSLSYPIAGLTQKWTTIYTHLWEIKSNQLT